MGVVTERRCTRNYNDDVGGVGRGGAAGSGPASPYVVTIRPFAHAPTPYASIQVFTVHLKIAALNVDTRPTRAFARRQIVLPKANISSSVHRQRSRLRIVPLAGLACNTSRGNLDLGSRNDRHLQPATPSVRYKRWMRLIVTSICLNEPPPL
ncbi:hypothetical protein EVAR_7777_1 [Eumeta japonica]|uniref:Uncharacterized protein n=1 Tax=Eumeta variegata TaxID=151549 RepID=A0A4C1TM89_EUMVA|nr:hypothetical protein EVAR_7777_1 [Eumeta japonica]